MNLTFTELLNSAMSYIKIGALKFISNKHFLAHGYKFYFGSNVKFRIRNKGIIDIGSKSWFSDNCQISVSKGKVQLGYNNFFNRNVSITALKEITIGDNNLFGPNIVIVDHNHKYDVSNMLINRQGFECDAIHIGSDCWFCANAVVCPGVTISDHIVVAASAVVTTDLIEPGVYGGIPAKLIKRKKG